MFWKFVIWMYKALSPWDEGLRTLSVQNDYSLGLIWKWCVKGYKTYTSDLEGLQARMSLGKQNVTEICPLSKAL